MMNRQPAPMRRMPSAYGAHLESADASLSGREQPVQAPGAAAGRRQVEKEETIQQDRIAAVAVRERAALERADEKQDEVHHREDERHRAG